MSLSPVPPIPLRDDPNEDSIWKRWLSQQRTQVNSTGPGSYTIGDLLVADSTTTQTNLPDVATGNVLLSGGIGAAPSYGKVDISTHVSGLGANVDTFLGTPSSANLAAALTDETGSGAAVFATSPTLITPALGTPTELVGTNITGTAADLTAGNVTTNANLTGPITSTGNATAVASQTGTGSKFVMDSAPSFNTTIGVGGATAAASGAGISFPATQSASTDANTLDDYEEGTFTPVATFATPGDLTVVYSTRQGTYTKIGRLVTATFNIVTSTFSYTTSSGDFNITGLPFAANATYTYTGIVRWGGVTKAGYTQLYVDVSPGASVLRLIASGSGVTPASVTTADIPNLASVVMRGCIQYEI